MEKIERRIRVPFLERQLARLPKQIRWRLADYRYQELFRTLQSWRTGADGQPSLAETERLNTIFVHIPKTAGVSVAKSLFGSLAASHTPVLLYLALYGQRRFDSMYKFTFVRNPWDRTISAFNFLKNGGMHEHDARWASTHLSDFADVNDFVLRGLVHRHIRDWIHFREQTYFILDPRTDQIGVDFIGRYENIEDDFKTVRDRLSSGSELQHLNAGTAGQADYRDILARKSIDTISDLYRGDMELLGY